MSNLRVRGFSYITFWQEDSIGLIVLKSDKNGNIRTSAFSELMQALALAAADEKVKYIAITGMNSFFAKDLYLKPEESIVDSLETMLSFSLFSSGVQKPVVSLINGDALNIGYEIALLTDLVISSEKARCGFQKDYKCLMGGTIARRRFYDPGISNAEKNKNSDIVIEGIDFLGQAKDFLLNKLRTNIFTERAAFRWDIKERIMEEQISFLKEYISKPKLKDSNLTQS